jgi:hypothetical protein
MDTLVAAAVDGRGSEPITDQELEELALAGDPDGPIDPGAVPYDAVVRSPIAALPQWYMPQVAISRCTGWRLPVAVAVVAALVVLEALGLCSVFGQVVIG